ncbi:MAG: glycoside hydrolase family 127 protein [Clostridia bacterium]|nr:glycoside hydrolase family 127 protein [Clostridia bacterium]
MKTPQYEDYNAKLAVPDRLFTPLHGVRLTGGLFRRVFTNNVGFLNRLEMDRMRYWFDVKLGRKPTAERYPGHFEDNLKGQTASQYLMGAGNALRWEEIPALRRGLEEILDFLEKSAEDDGFLMPIDKTRFAYREYPHYVRIWLTYGLIAAARAGDPRALPLLRRWQDWFNHCPDLPVIKYLELAFQGVVASPAVYLTEVGRKEDADVSREAYEEPWRLAQFIGMEEDAVHVRRQHGKEPHTHGSEIEAFEGYLDMYRIYGAPYFLNAVMNFRTMYRDHWQHVGGGIVMIETLNNGNPLAPDCNYFLREHGGKESTYNELCCTSFWLHLHQRLHRMFPDVEEYVFEMEESLYNVAIANQNGSADIRYCAYLDGEKQLPVRLNHCCAGVGTRIFGSLPEYLFTLNRDTLSCDIYAAARLDWETEVQTVTVTEETDFPQDGAVTLRFDMEKSQEFTLRIRIPRYAAGPVPVLLGGVETAVGEPGTYLVLTREWKDGDTVSFRLELAWQAHLYHGVDETPGYDRYAYTYGPLLMAVTGERNHTLGVVLSGDGRELPSKLRPEGKPLCWVPEDDPERKVVPYYAIQTERFTVFPMFRKPGAEEE